MPPAFLDIVVAFALFRRSAINLTIYRDFDPKYHLAPFYRAQPHYYLCTLTATAMFASERGRYFKGHFHASVSQQEISSKKQTFPVVLERVLF